MLKKIGYVLNTQSRTRKSGSFRALQNRGDRTPVELFIAAAAPIACRSAST
jgi:hypothetical protein